MTVLGVSRRTVAVAALSVLAVATLGIALGEMPAVWSRTVAYGLAMQRELHRELATAIRAVQQAEVAALWSLLGLGFLYGVFHAVGPGHGKMVISTYLATHESRLRRGVALSALSSLLQGATAIAAVGATVAILDRSLRETQSAALSLETVSYGLVALLGLFLAWRSGRRLLKRALSHDHDHTATNRAAHCCRGHGPTVTDLAAPPSFRHFVVAVLSVGVRPCSGAVLVLVLAYAMHLVWAGVVAVLAMSVGTAITVSALAAVSVYARKSAIALASQLADGGRWLPRTLDAVAMLGGILIILLGLGLLHASLSIARHPLL
jgi:nickel/cobalt transporter (NicO) family protein